MASSNTLCVTGGSMLTVPLLKIFTPSMMKLLPKELQILQLDQRVLDSTKVELQGKVVDQEEEEVEDLQAEGVDLLVLKLQLHLHVALIHPLMVLLLLTHHQLILYMVLLAASMGLMVDLEMDTVLQDLGDIQG